MRIKTFEASTLQDALSLARNELGEDAVVLNTKHVRAGGLRGFRGETKIELMAAVDDAVAQMEPAPVSSVALLDPGRPKAPPVTPVAARAYASLSHSQIDDAAEIRQLRSEIDNLSSIVQGLLSYDGSPKADFSTPLRFARNDEERDVRSAPDPRRTTHDSGLLPDPRRTTHDSGLLPDPRRTTHDSGLLPDSRRTTHDSRLLLDLGVDEDLAASLLPELLSIQEPYALASALASRMQAFAAPPTLDAKQVIAFVGPTGVGKTTTLAKLAARFSLEQGKKVALVTADTFRIGAVEQLKTYARIMGVPLEIALTPEEVAEGVAKHQDKDVVLIDTVGRSQRSDEHLAELKSFVAAAKPTETCLLVAASLDKGVQAEVVERFALLSPTNLVITKLDECASFAGLVNLPLRTNLALSCITTGQNVPQDIELADAGRIARLVTGVA